ncbi:MAG: DUF1223 domain-containing protein [Phycisphaerales bacterium]|nr:DUF1223 domain-containing protein [Phycisphaerales bacterium]
MHNPIFAAALVASITTQTMSAPQPQTPAPTQPSPQIQPQPQAETVPVVVELFTSEGCSSCPPAEHVASQIAGSSRDKNARVIVLAFHVDYWDYLGWPDRFSSKAATERQHAYADALGSRGLYTPQLIVGGRREFVGSDSDRANHEITKASSQISKVTLATTINWVAPTPESKPSKSTQAKPTPANTPKSPLASSSTLEVTLSVSDGESLSKSSTELLYLAAIVEDGLESKVTRGENAGHTLKHDAVVRAFTTGVAPSKPQTVSLTLPKDVNREHARVVTLVQDAKTMAILAASESPLPSVPSAKPPRPLLPPPRLSARMLFNITAIIGGLQSGGFSPQIAPDIAQIPNIRVHRVAGPVN